MDITISKKDLLRLVSRCQGVADKKSAMPVLANVLLVAEPGKVTCSATDLYLAVSGSAAADVAKPGSVCLEAASLRERLATLPDGPVRLRTQKDRAELTSVGTKRRFQMSFLDGDDFPALPSLGDGRMFTTLPTEQLESLLDRVHLAVSKDPTRAHVNSMLFEVADGTLRCVATDGHRLSIASQDQPGSFGSILVPLRALTEIRKLVAASTDETVTLNAAGPYLQFTADGFTFSCKLVDATFPPYRQVIPKDSKHTVTVGRLQFIDALRAASVASSDRTSGVALEFGADSIRITAQSPEGGEASDEVPSTGGPAEPARIGFNAGYLVDALSVLDSDEVTVAFSGELDPAVVRAEGFVGVVMPMRTT